MKILIDTGPLVSAVDRDDPAHRMASAMLDRLRRSGVVPSTVMVEADHLVRKRVGDEAARRLLRTVARGAHEVAYMSSGLMRRAAEMDDKYADLRLGLVDASVMAIAERHDLPIFTFDFRDFRATESANGPWRLAVDERLYGREVAE
ncbi:MAG TPA: PIN domain-containing protein [Solirubrobacterales bacterium]|nr:PIN domain-containing protein [Solirubrobacterales bacterium]